jgi:hypothetical protein
LGVTPPPPPDSVLPDSTVLRGLGETDS